VRLRRYLPVHREFVRQHAMEEDRTIQWLQENGGNCDCEALNNIEEIV